MGQINARNMTAPRNFDPPIVKTKGQGEAAFHAYDWYFNQMKNLLRGAQKVFLTPCAATKPIHTSSLHRSIYQKYVRMRGFGRLTLVVSEPVVLIRYKDLYELESHFCYDFPPKLLSPECRAFFVRRLKSLLSGKDIQGCLPRHHAALINDAVGLDWENYWQGDLYSMMKKASRLEVPSL